jgi:hypothetical protein
MLSQTEYLLYIEGSLAHIGIQACPIQGSPRFVCLVFVCPAFVCPAFVCLVFVCPAFVCPAFVCIVFVVPEFVGPEFVFPGFVCLMVVDGCIYCIIVLV